MMGNNEKTHIIFFMLMLVLIGFLVIKAVFGIDEELWETTGGGDLQTAFSPELTGLQFGHPFRGNETPTTTSTTTTTTTTTTTLPTGGGGGRVGIREIGNVIFIDYPFGRSIKVMGDPNVFIKKSVKILNDNDYEATLNYAFVGSNCLLNKKTEVVPAKSITEIEMTCSTEYDEDVNFLEVKEGGNIYERQVRFKKETFFDKIVLFIKNNFLLILFILVVIYLLNKFYVNNKKFYSPNESGQ